MKLYAGIDLPANNNYLVVIDERDQAVFRRKQANVGTEVLRNLAGFQGQLVGIVVESTYNWYWLVDELMPAGYRVHLANPAGIRQYEGIKQTNDWSDAHWLAHLLRLGILREGYIYPRERRAVRDLLRKRRQLVQQRSAQLISIQTLVNRNTGDQITSSHLKQLSCPEVEGWYEEPERVMAVQASLRVQQALEQEIKRIEKQVKGRVKLEAGYQRLLRVWGIGEILALTIMLETGELSRFASVGDYSSYCRCVQSQRLSNGRKKGENNAKCGNRYLAGAYVEAAHFAARFYDRAQAFVARKTAQVNRALALKALANKLCRASYYVMRDGVEFEPTQLFGS